MQELIIDGKKLNSVEALHTFLQQTLQLPNFYGRNLDALYDCLTGFVEVPLTIRWIHFADSANAFGEMREAIVETIEDAVECKKGIHFIIEN